MCKPGAGCCPGHTSSGGSGLLAVLGASAVVAAGAYVVAKAIVAVFPVIVGAAALVALWLIWVIARNRPRRFAHISHPGAFMQSELAQAQLAIRQRNQAWNRRARALRAASQPRALHASPAQRPAIPPAAPPAPGYITGVVVPDAVPVITGAPARHGLLRERP